MTDYSVLSDADVNELVATRVMGWHALAFLGSGWNPTQNHDHAARLRLRIAELKLERSFMFALGMLLPQVCMIEIHDGVGVSMRNAFEILNAPLRDQCEAALSAMEDHDE